jgi:hypothetical protein
MTPRVRARLDELFVVHRDDATALLERECGANLPLVADALTLERIQIACIKLSAGSLVELERAIGVAKIDWRDVLVAAGFADDTRAHQRWRP